jgi:Tat protein secretion system quality control protein TatD with DNase activity
MGISCELFEEMRDRVIGMYALRHSQIAPSPTLDFQKSRNRITLAEALQATVNHYILEGAISEEQRTGLIYHLKHEVVTYMRLKGSEPEIRPKIKSLRRNHTFLYRTLGVTPENFRHEFDVSEEDLWDMLAYIAERYENAKRKHVRIEKTDRQRQIQQELLHAARQIVDQSGAGEVQRKNLYHALLRINGRAGGNAAHRSFLQPSLPFAS